MFKSLAELGKEQKPKRNRRQKKKKEYEEDDEVAEPEQKPEDMSAMLEQMRMLKEQMAEFAKLQAAVAAASAAAAMAPPLAHVAPVVTIAPPAPILSLAPPPPAPVLNLAPPPPAPLLNLLAPIPKAPVLSENITPKTPVQKPAPVTSVGMTLTKEDLMRPLRSIKDSQNQPRVKINESVAEKQQPVTVGGKKIQTRALPGEENMSFAEMIRVASKVSLKKAVNRSPGGTPLIKSRISDQHVFSKALRARFKNARESLDANTQIAPVSEEWE